MKRVMKFVKQNIVGIIIGIVLTGVGVVTAANIVHATGVAYSNSASNVTNVSEALDELFEATGNSNKGQLIKFGNWNPNTTSGTFTYDISAYPDLTVDNVFIVWGSLQYGDMNNGGQGYAGFTKTISNNTLTIKANYRPNGTGVTTNAWNFGNSVLSIIAYY